MAPNHPLRTLFLSTTWPRPTIYPLRYLFLLQFLLLTTLLGLFGYAQPDQYRTALRLVGARNGFTSDAFMFTVSNGEDGEEKETPVVYTGFATTFNLNLTILTFLLLCLQAALHFLRFFPPLPASLLNLILVIFWCIDAAVYQAGTTAPSDEKPWWTSRGCGSPGSIKKVEIKDCTMAQSALGVSVVLVVVCAVVAGLGTVAAVKRWRRRELGKKGEEEEGEAGKAGGGWWDANINKAAREARESVRVEMEDLGIRKNTNDNHD